MKVPLIFCLLVIIFIIIFVQSNFSKQHLRPLNLQKWKRKILSAPGPFEVAQTGPGSIAPGVPYENTGRVIYKDDFSPKMVYTQHGMNETDSGTFESTVLEKDMLNCYRRDADNYCVPNVLSNSCQECNDFEDPPNSGCFAGDQTCANNYKKALAGITQYPIRTGSVQMTGIPVTDGYLANACVTVLSAETMNVLGTFKTDSNGYFSIPKTWGIVVVKAKACSDGTKTIDISIGEEFKGELTAVGDAAERPVVTPLTSMTASILIEELEKAAKNDTPLTLDEIKNKKTQANSDVASALGISPDDMDIDYSREENNEVAKKAMQISATEKMIASATGSGSDVMKLLATAIKEKAGTSFDFTDSTNIESVATQAMSENNVSDTSYCPP